MTEQEDPIPAPTSEAERELTDAELAGITGGTGVLVHERVHAGTTTKPPPTPAPTTPATSTRSPPSFG